MTKKFSINVPDSIYSDLERWAEQEGTKLASLAAFLVERDVRQARESGKISSGTRSLQTLLEQMAQGEKPTDEQISTVASSLGIASETLLQLRDRLSV
jgi:hypothetical protein